MKDIAEFNIRQTKIGSMVDLLSFFNVASIDKLDRSKEFRIIVETIQEQCKQVLFLGCSSNGDKLDLVYPTMIATIALVNNCPICIRTSKLFKML